MASDQEYTDFLNKANSDPNAGRASTASKSKGSKMEFRATEDGVEVPKALKDICDSEDLVYMSEADEPFVPVALTSEGGWPKEGDFASLIHHPDPDSAEVEIMSTKDWDPQGQYKEAVEAVKKTGGGGDVKVYRVAKDGTRAEYWVLALAGKGKEARLVGVKALAVES